MNIKEHTDKFIKVLLNPAIGWKNTNFSELSYKNIIFPYLSGILIICFLSRIIGKSLTYLSISSIQYIVLYAILSFFVDYLFFIGVVFSIKILMPYYDVNPDKDKASIVLFITLIPFYASVIILNLFPSLFFLAVISLYSFYILYCGTLHYFKVNKIKQIIFFTVTSLIIIGLYLILHFTIIYPFFEYLI